MDNHEEQAAIEEDRRKHPDCFYSTSLSSSYSWVNGESRAETLKRIIRNCPRQTPVEIYTRRDANQGQQAPPPISADPALSLPIPSIGGDIFGGLLGDFQRLFEGFPFDAFPESGGGGGGGGGFGFSFPTQPEKPEHQQPQPPSRQPAYPPPHKFPRGNYPGPGGQQRAYSGPGGDEGVEEV